MTTAAKAPTREHLIRPDLAGDLSRNLLLDEDHPEAWVFISGPWSGLVFSPCSGQRGTPEPLAPTTRPWTPGGQR